MLWRRLPYVIAIATVISAVGVAIAYQLPDLSCTPMPGASLNTYWNHEKSA
jgi:hypothetical protein